MNNCIKILCFLIVYCGAQAVVASTDGRATNSPVDIIFGKIGLNVESWAPGFRECVLSFGIQEPTEVHLRKYIKFKADNGGASPTNLSALEAVDLSPIIVSAKSFATMTWQEFLGVMGYHKWFYSYSLTSHLPVAVAADTFAACARLIEIGVPANSPYWRDDIIWMASIIVKYGRTNFDMRDIAAAEYLVNNSPAPTGIAGEVEKGNFSLDMIDKAKK